jgi:hypothetical protein
MVGFNGLNHWSKWENNWMIQEVWPIENGRKQTNKMRIITRIPTNSICSRKFGQKPGRITTKHRKNLYVFWFFWVSNSEHQIQTHTSRKIRIKIPLLPNSWTIVWNQAKFWGTSALPSRWRLKAQEVSLRQQTQTVATQSVNRGAGSRRKGYLCTSSRSLSWCEIISSIAIKPNRLRFEAPRVATKGTCYIATVTAQSSSYLEEFCICHRMCFCLSHTPQPLASI